MTESSNEGVGVICGVSQAVNMRRTGLDVVGEVAWGSHFCQFYDTQEDLLDIVVPYFRAGLESNEFCMWITSDPLSVEQASAALASAVPDLERRIAAGQMEILDYRQWYLLAGRFDADRVLQGWVDKLETALDRGFDGLRLSGSTFWLEESLWRSFSDYEAAVDNVINKYRMLALCTYSLEKCGVFEVMDVVCNHQFGLVRRGKRWEILESTRRKEAESALRESEARRRQLAEAMPQLVWTCTPQGQCDYLSRQWVEYTGKSEAEQLGYRWLEQVHPDDRDGLMARWNEAVAGGTGFNVEFRIRRRDGAWRWFKTRARPVRDAAGRVVKWYGSNTDIEDLKRAEDILERQAEELRIANEELGAQAGELRATNEELREREQALRDSEERYRRFFADDLTGDFIASPDGRVIECNPAFARMYGFANCAEAVGCDLSRFDPEGWTDALARVKSGRTVRSYQSVHRCPDGRNMCVVANIVGQLAESGELTAVQGYIFDDTQRKHAEEALQSAALFPEQNPAPVLRVARDGTLLYANASSVLLLESWDCRPGQAAPDLIRRCVEQALDSHEITEVEAICGSIVYSFSIAPIASDGYANLYGRDITKRKQAEEAVRREREALRDILDNMPDGVYIANQNYEIEYINPVLEREFGPVAGEKCYDYFHDRQEVCPWCKNAEVSAGHTIRWEWRSPKNQKTYDLISTPLHKPDGSTSKLEIFRDVTERQRAERLLEETNRRLTSILDSISDGFFTLEGDFVITYFNHAAERLLGRKREEVLGRNLLDAFPEVRGSIFHEKYVEAMRDRKSVALEAYFGIAPYENWYDVRVYPYENGLAVYFQVTTERKRAETALRDSEQRLRLALEGGRMGLWEWDLETDSRFWDQRAYELLGLEPFGQAKRETFFSHVHPQDRETLEKLVADTLAGHEDFEAEFRIVCHRQEARGEIRWVASRAKVLRDEQGRGVRMLGILYDITQHKQMEAALRQMNERLEEEVQAQTEELRDSVGRLRDEVGRRTVAENRLHERSRMLEAFFQHTITPLAFMDRQFNFVRVNEAYAKADDKSPEYFVGKNHFSLYPDEENETIFERVVQTRQAYAAYAKPFTYPYAPERGVTYWNWQLTPLLDDSGDVQFLVLNLENVTGRQRAFHELEQRARQLQQLALELSEAEDRERKRLAEILHDDLQQQLAAAKFHLGLLSRRAKTDHATGKIAAQLDQMLKDAIEKSRSLSHELSPTVLYQADLSGMFQWLARQLQTKHGLMVRVEIRGAVDLQSESLKAFLFRAAQEILFNVVKHARTGEARLRLRRVRGRLRLSISDKGQGFDPDLLRQTGGFGLLSIRERLELLGGRMKIKSAKGRGSVFLIMLPDGRMMKMAQSTPESIAARSTGYDEGAEHSRDHRLRVLLVDDHKVMREGLATLLNEQEDMEVVGQAGNGREAVDMAYKLEPDVIVMDAAMPVMPGDEATRQIRLHLPHTRIIALSMFAESEMAEAMRQSGAEAYLLKTAPSEKLLAAIRGR